ncbi:unnamed protein product [Onchocerca flexuosa]|uniref:Secreted protein n=1 Tax=Onchocerca flexuosa TaxID=387005 RepID=A0A183HMP5_9BILA|nr:unnamed protein product [Onchocerca flexuosa]
MFQWFFVVILSFGLLRSVIQGYCSGTNCGGNSGGFSGSSRCIPTNCYHYHQLHRRMLDCGFANCNIGKNVIGDNCCNCCCNRISSLPFVNDNNDRRGDASARTIGYGTSSSTDYNSKDVDANTSAEGSESSSDVSSTSDKTSSEIESNCPPCPPPSPCSSSSSQPLTSSRHENTQLLTKNQALLLLPEGIPIIPSPQLDLLTSGSNFKFNNIQDLHLSTIKPPSSFNQKPPIQDQPVVDNLPSHDCCTRCSSASCMTRNKNAILLAANTYTIRRNRRTKCKSYELAKLMMMRSLFEHI